MPQEISFQQIDFSEIKIPLETSVNAQTGDAITSLNIPITTGRNGFQPALALAYNSGSGNSAFGLGWGLQGLSFIGLSLKDGYPNYNGSDKFSFNGQKLIPWHEEVDDRWQARRAKNDTHFIEYYRVNLDSNFTRFEKWTHKGDRKMHWRVHNRNNQVMIFGLNDDDSTKIYDPENPDKIFQWLLEAQFDNTGNAIEYEYINENFINVDGNSSYERNRLFKGSSNAQKYLKRIRYGNTIPALPNVDHEPSQSWLFELILDYGDQEVDGRPLYITTPGIWPSRQDPFSSYIAGFEQRTYRLCERILMFHHFDELGTGPTLVGNTNLIHQPDPAGTTLNEIRYTAYKRTGAESYDSKSLPPTLFEYTSPAVERSFQEAPEQGNDNIPVGLGGLNYKWIDLYGEGLPGVLYESNDVWYYKPNLGEGRLGEQRKVTQKPSSGFGSYALSDFDGDGNLNLVVLQGRESGYFEYNRDKEDWNGFKSFEAAPHVRQMDVYTQLIDLTGDGRSDILTVEEDRIIWYPSKGKEGFNTALQISKPVSNGVSRAPTLGSNPMLDYFFADMNGSGLPDQVRVYNGRVEYWPNMGNGKFGAGIVMEDSPQLDFDFELDASRIRLVDLDGSGTSDLIYIGRGEIKYWINASGNRFMEGNTLTGLPFIDNVSSAQVIDFLGDGTPCLVWSSALPMHTDAPLHYLRLTNGIKPRLLMQSQNSMGLETVFHYGYSGTHYLRDKVSPDPWITKLPSHRVVVNELEVIDHIGNTRFKQLFEYHDGFFDGEERTFRGFCLVDQYDSDSYGGTSTVPPVEFTDPVCVRTWFHNGAEGWQKKRENRYYQEDQYSTQLSDFFIENSGQLKHNELFDTLRSLAGQVIHSETYGLTPEGDRKPTPFQVDHATYTIRRVQPGDKERDAVFTVFPRESLNIVYEEDAADPKLTHSLTLEIDADGITRKECAISYPRRHPDALDEQWLSHSMATAVEVTGFDERNRYEIGIELENKSYELRNGSTPAEGSLYTFDYLRDLIETTIRNPIRFNEEFGTTRQARLLQWSKNYFWNDDQTEILPWGNVGNKVLLHHQEAACFHEDFLADTLGDFHDPEYIATGFYNFHDNFWWQPGATTENNGADSFYTPAAEIQADGGRMEYEYDDYHLTLTATTSVLADEAGTVLARNQTSGVIDYHLLAPYRIEDANGNSSEVMYDPFGVIILSSAYGEILSNSEVLQPYGHSPIVDYVPTSEANFETVLTNPNTYLQECASYFYYELDTWQRDSLRLPLRSIALAREEWVHDGEGNYNPESNFQLKVEYKDGFSRTIQSKALVEAGPDTIQYDDAGAVVVDSQGEPQLRTTDDPRWLVSGSVIYNNKQEPIRQFEPYFSPVVAFENDEILETFGESGWIEYDALGRQKRMILADGSRARSEITPWQTRQFDANDDVVGSLYETRIETSHPSDSPERLALEKSRRHNNTPLISHLDGLGRTFLTEEADENGRIRRNRIVLDALGNPREIIDPRNLTAFNYIRDMQGRVFYEQSMDAGPKWQFLNGLDQAIHLWDGKSVHHQMFYDTWGRVTQKRVNGASEMNADHLTERFVYGEDASVTNASQRNLLGQLVEHYDQAGISRVHRYDLAGNVLLKDRRLVEDYLNLPDWSSTSAITWMDDPPFETRATYDALGRPKEQNEPDATTRNYSYLSSGALHQFLLTTADGDMVDQPISEGHVYNAKGQIKEMTLGNRVVQQYEYDQFNFRLRRKHAFRRATETLPAKQYQNVRYTYDAVGNITHLIDTAQPNPTVLFNQPRVNQYTYDAFYQLTLAEGRTHQALQRIDYAHAPDAPGFIKGTRHINLDNMALIQSYTRRYSYDLSGNMQSLVHHSGSRPSDTLRWRRDFWISENSNRSLESKDLNGNDIPVPETRFDENGNLTYLSHLRSIQWNYLNQLASAVIIERPAGDHDAEYYMYGGDGQRVRKVTQRLDNDTLEITEKIYLDGCEIKRVKHGDTPLLERYTSHLNDGSGRVAFMHRWTRDTRNRETDDISQYKIHYQLSCHLGSSAFELDEQGEIINYEEYFAFGCTAFLYGDRLRDVRLKDYRYSGKERDDATGLYYYGFRYYAPWQCRWLNPDPIGPEDGLNVYLFVHNNPINKVDFVGLQSNITQIPLSSSEIEDSQFGPSSQSRLIEGHAFLEMGSYGNWFESPQEYNDYVERNPEVIGNVYYYDPNKPDITFYSFDDEAEEVEITPEDFNEERVQDVPDLQESNTNHNVSGETVSLVPESAETDITSDGDSEQQTEVNNTGNKSISTGTSWRDNLSTGQRFALWVDDFIGTQNLQNATDFSAGVGRSLTFGLTDHANRALGNDNAVNLDSTASRLGEVTGDVVMAVTTGGAGTLRAAAGTVIRDQVQDQIMEVTGVNEVIGQGISSASAVVGLDPSVAGTLIGLGGAARAGLRSRRSNGGGGNGNNDGGSGGEDGLGTAHASSDGVIRSPISNPEVQTVRRPSRIQNDEPSSGGTEFVRPEYLHSARQTPRIPERWDIDELMARLEGSDEILENLERRNTRNDLDSPSDGGTEFVRPEHLDLARRTLRNPELWDIDELMERLDIQDTQNGLRQSLDTDVPTVRRNGLREALQRGDVITEGRLSEVIDILSTELQTGPTLANQSKAILRLLSAIRRRNKSSLAGRSINPNATVTLSPEHLNTINQWLINSRN